MIDQMDPPIPHNPWGWWMYVWFWRQLGFDSIDEGYERDDYHSDGRPYYYDTR